jgi:hypothetical protein
MLSRTLFYALVAINIVLAVLLILPLFGVVPAWSSADEPERIAKQLAPDLIRVLPSEPSKPTASAPALIETSTSSPASEQSAVVPSPAASSPATKLQVHVEDSAPTPQVEVEVADSQCMAIKGLSEELAGRVGAQAKKHGELIKVKSYPMTSTVYWVHIPPDGGKEAAERRVEVLQRNGVDDYFVVREAGENQYAVSLGLYHAEESAKRRIEALQSVGIKTAKVTKRENSLRRVEFNGSQKVLDDVLVEINHTRKDKPLQRERCEGG